MPTLPDFVEDLGDGVYAIDTGFHRPRYDAAYLVVSDEGRAAFVDTGTNHSLPRHLGALDALGLPRDAVDYVIPTHVHLDHAGGAGALMRALPSATLIVHPRGERHLVDPRALWDGALAVYGAEVMARDYGELIAVDAARVRTTHDGMDLMLGTRTLHFIDTPGHARHHHCIWDERTRGWFTGDTFGASLREFDRPGRGAWITPSTVPTQLEPAPLRRSIERLLAKRPDSVYLTHYGRVRNVPVLARRFLAMLDAVEAIGHAQRSAPDRHAALRRELAALYTRSLAEHGIDATPAVLALLEVDIELNAQGVGHWLDREARERMQEAAS